MDQWTSEPVLFLFLSVSVSLSLSLCLFLSLPLSLFELPIGQGSGIVPEDLFRELGETGAPSQIVATPGQHQAVALMEVPLHHGLRTGLAGRERRGERSMISDRS